MSNKPFVGRRPASLALRVTLLVGIATTLVFLSFNWVVLRALHMHFSEQDAGELDAVAKAVVNTLQAENQDGASLVQRLSAIAVGHHGVFYGVFDNAGRMVYATPGPDLSAISPPSKSSRFDPDSLLVWDEGGKSYRGGAFWVDAPDTGTSAPRVVVAMDIDFHVHFLDSFKQMQRWATGIVLLISIVVAWLAVQWGHRPIRKITREIQAIRSSQLDVRLHPADVPMELAELATSFNDMIGRLEDSFSKLSHFSGDIAHELRTPVTNLVTQTEVALSQARSDDEYREILYSNLEEFDRMGRMIGDMLFLAQTENDPGNLHRSDIDLAELIRGLFDYFEALAEDAGIVLRLEGGAQPVRADKEMILRALSNLLSNAIRYTPRGASVTVSLTQDEQWTRIRVENPGQKIPEQYLPKLFDRFFRVDPARQRDSAGAGLGLAIVKSIAQAHGGTVSVTSDDIATKFELTLPRVA